MEFVGPGVANLSADFRIGVDVMTTETTCLSSIWSTDEKVKEMLKDNAFCVVTPDKQPKVDFIAPTVFYMPKE